MKFHSGKNRLFLLFFVTGAAFDGHSIACNGDIYILFINIRQFSLDDNYIITIDDIDTGCFSFKGLANLEKGGQSV